MNQFSSGDATASIHDSYQFLLHQLPNQHPFTITLAITTTLLISLYFFNYLLYLVKPHATSSFRWRYYQIRLHQAIVSLPYYFCCIGCRRPPWSNPTIYNLGNVLKAHVPLRIYDNAEAAIKDEKGDFPFDSTISPENRKYIISKWQMSLNGVWKFQLFSNPECIQGSVPPAVPKLASTTISSVQKNQLVNINVPGCWEMQGHDIPIYTNIQYPWLLKGKMCNGWCQSFSNLFAGYHSGDVPSKNPTGIYRRSFQLPNEWQPEIQSNQRNVILHVGSVSSAARVFVNGIDVGYFQDSFTETEIDITKAVQQHGVKKEHVVVLQVMRFSDGSWLEDQDHWWLSGINRSVFLQSRPLKNAIVDYHTSTTLSNGYQTGVLQISVMIQAPIENDVITFVLYDANQNIVHQTTSTCIFNENEHGNGHEHEHGNEHNGNGNGMEWKRTVCIEIDSPQLWSSEDPNLYTLSIATTTHCEITRVGFREIEIST